MPAKIQDLIERNIRTLSNSLSNKGSMVQEMMGAALGIKDLREKWLTKQERFMHEGADGSSFAGGDPQLRNRKNDGDDMSSLEDPNRMLKFK